MVSDSDSSEPSLRQLDGESAGELRAVLAALEGGAIAVDREAAARLVELLGHASKEVRRRAAGALATAAANDAVDVELVRAALRDPCSMRRFGAAFALARAGRTEAAITEAAVEALGDDDGDVRWAAAGIVCSAAASDAALKSRLYELSSCDKVERRKMALYCLRDLGETDPARFLPALGDHDPNVRMAALAGIGRAGNAAEHVIDALIALARADGVAGVRRAAVGVLGMVGLHSVRARQALEKFCDDPDANAARAARAALARYESTRG